MPGHEFQGSQLLNRFQPAGNMKVLGERLRDLPGLGPVSENHLNEIGIFTRDDLEKTGPVRVYLMLRASGHANLNFLYAMVGALNNVHWTRIARKEKGRLLMELEGQRELERIFNHDA